MVILDWRPKESARDYAVRVILYNIVHLELAPGSEVSSTKLSAALSLSRMPLREALAELSRMGLVDVLPQRGTYISKIDYDLVEESRFIRLVLEVAVAKQACKGIEPHWLDEMRDNLDAYRRLLHVEDDDRRLELDNKFHQLIFASVNRLWTYQKLKDQMVHFDRLRKLSMSFYAAKAEDTLKDHEDILYAITRHDSEMAEMLVVRHLSRYQAEISDIIAQYPDYFVQKKQPLPGKPCKSAFTVSAAPD